MKVRVGDVVLKLKVRGMEPSLDVGLSEVDIAGKKCKDAAKKC